MRRLPVAVLALCVTSLLCASAAAQAQMPPRAARASNPAATAASPVNINTASATQLDALPGVGLKLAERIVDYRQKNGGFKKIEDLMNVQGIGEKNFLKLKPLITIGAARAEQKAGEK